VSLVDGGVKAGNEVRMEVANGLRDFTWNLDILGEGYER